MMLTETADRTRAYIKIQDGCNQFCSYCLIPYARGRVRSRDMEDILEEIRAITKKGYEEIVLTGIHVSSYGITSPNDLSQNRLGELLTKIQEIETVKRIRLSSLEPRVVTEEFAKTIGGLSKL
ncbi:MAG: radical SAM protein, partial [Lachnospiraceae bacterium]|nr:radical SAM protein [Lachnospiraceae bacterium]